MPINARIAAVFEEMADILELLGEDRFRVGAYQRAARAIESLSADLADIADDKAKLTAIDGIGPKIADKVAEFAATGQIKEHQEALTKVPQSLLPLLTIPGLGPKTVALLWKERSVTSLADLKRIIDDGSILTLPRMGQKTVDNLKAAILFAQSGGERLPLGRVLPLAEAIVAHLKQLPAVAEAAFAGSLRRGRDTIGDVDILVATDDPPAIHKAFTTMPGVETVLASGATKSSIRIRVGVSTDRRMDAQAGGPLLQADLRTLPPKHWGAGLLYFTGSKEHNVRLRERALKQNSTLNEYGLYPEDDDPTPPQSRNITPIASRTEEDIYKALGLPWIPPELREDHGELQLTATPRLVTASDIKSELHAHTNESDGGLPLEELVRLAKGRGFHTIAVTDHSKSSVQAGGLSVERLREQGQRIRELQERTESIRILTGSEVDILLDGRLDYDDDVLAELDVVVASPHAALTQDSKKATKRLLKTIAHPMVHVLGHPTGRLITRRKGLEPAMDELIAAAKEHNVALEINAHWMRLDLRDTHVRAAVEAGCMIAINCDVHAPTDFDNIRFGIMTARRGWLPPEQCVNAWPADRLHAWLASKR